MQNFIPAAELRPPMVMYVPTPTGSGPRVVVASMPKFHPAESTALTREKLRRPLTVPHYTIEVQLPDGVIHELALAAFAPVELEAC